MIVIEGNIGSGKSEILNHLGEMGYLVKQEPIEAWTLFDDFYNNQEKYSFAFQSQVVLSYSNFSNCIIERSPRSSIQVFAKMLNKQKKISDLQLSILCALHNELPIPDVDMLIYLDVPSSICYDRIQLRGRKQEKNITIEYLDQIDHYYKEYINDMKKSLTNVITIDCNTKSSKELAKEICLKI